MKLPLVSIITVVYNAVHDIERTIRSVITQTYNNFEFIIVDGGSKDGTLERISLYREYVSVLISEPDKGIYDAMNKGVSFSSGEWVIFMNAGDTFYNEDVIKRALDYQIPNGIKLIYGDYFFVNADKNSCLRRQCNIKRELLPFSLCHQATIISGDFIREHKFNTKYRIAADSQVFYDLFQLSGNNALYVPEIICLYDASGYSSMNLLDSFKEYCEIRGLKKTSLAYWGSYSKTLIRYFTLKLFPSAYQSLYMWYAKLKNR